MNGDANFYSVSPWTELWSPGTARGRVKGLADPRNFCQGPLWSLKPSVKKQVKGPAQQDAYEIWRFWKMGEARTLGGQLWRRWPPPPRNEILAAPLSPGINLLQVQITWIGGFSRLDNMLQVGDVLVQIPRSQGLTGADHESGAVCSFAPLTSSALRRDEPNAIRTPFTLHSPSPK